jgi:hypothetical protein
MDAIIREKNNVQAFQLLRTMTYAVIDARSNVKIVEKIVIVAEFAKDLQKFIFCMASGKFAMVNPCAPINANGSDVISAFTLNTLITTRMNGKIKQKNKTIKRIIINA